MGIYLSKLEPYWERGFVVRCMVAATTTYTVYCFAVKPFLSPLRKIPGLPYNPIFGNVREAMVGEAFTTSIKWVQKYGPVVRYYHLFGKERLLVAGPEAMRHVLVTNQDNYTRPRFQVVGFEKWGSMSVLGSSGSIHKLHRRILNPLFGPSAVKEYFPAMVDGIQDLVSLWCEKLAAANEGHCIIDIQRDLNAAVLDIFGVSLLGHQFDTLHNPGQDIERAFKTVANVDALRFFSSTRLYKCLPTAHNKRLQESVQIIEELMDNIIHEKRKELSETDDVFIPQRGDLVGRMMLAQDSETGQRLDDELIKANLFVLLQAGHETTATTLAWILLLLAQHQDIQEKARKEVVAKLPPRNEKIESKHIDQLSYLSNIIKEGQRLYPVAPVVLRYAECGDYIGQYYIPAGTEVVLHFGCMHRDPNLFPNPEEFKPDRFIETTEDEPTHDAFSYLPFGTGATKCLGHIVARLEIRLILAVLLREFRFTTTPHVHYHRKAKLLLHPVPDIRLHVQKL